MEIVLICILVALCVLTILLVRRQAGSQTSTQTLLLIQQQTDSLRGEIRENLRAVTENLNQQLAMVSTQLQSQTQNVGSRLDHAARVIGDVQKNLGELGKATEEIKDLGESVSKLDNLLRAPKLRGGLGEFLLEDLLRQVLPAEHYTMQYRFRNGTIVDAVIHTSDRLTPVDSKFPLENFKKMVEAVADPDRRSAQRAFVGDVRKHIDAIAGKYILPDEGTFPFALMYVPAENIYYEIILNRETTGNDGLYAYAMEQHVIPVSPNSFYAYLLVITLGLRGLKIEERARELQNTLGGMHADVVRLRDVFDTLGTHIENARKKFEDVDKHLSRFEGKLEKISDGINPPSSQDTSDEHALVSS